VTVYFAPISSFEGESVSRSYFEELRELFWHVASKQSHPPSLFAAGLGRIIDPGVARGGLKARFCSTGAGRVRIVDSGGDVYECYQEAGDRARRIAALAGGAVRYFQLENVYKRRHILSIAACGKCSIGLFCGGGCMNLARRHKGSVFKPFCQQNKELVGQTLRAYFRLQQEGKAGGFCSDSILS
jgi:radical SAM protein with 4Fe4S-binding SPASM domain